VLNAVGGLLSTGPPFREREKKSSSTEVHQVLQVDLASISILLRVNHER